MKFKMDTQNVLLTHAQDLCHLQMAQWLSVSGEGVFFINQAKIRFCVICWIYMKI